MYRSHTVTSPYLFRHLPAATVPNRSSTVKRRGYAGSPTWPSRVSPYLHRGHSSCRFSTVSSGGHTVEIRFMPEELRWCLGISRCCFAARRVPVSPGCFKKIKQPGPLPGKRRFNTVYPDYSMRRLPLAACPHCSDAGTENRNSVNEALYATV